MENDRNKNLTGVENAPIIGITKLICSAYKTVENHYQNSAEEPLNLIITGQDDLEIVF